MLSFETLQFRLSFRIFGNQTYLFLLIQAFQLLQNLYFFAFIISGALSGTTETSFCARVTTPPYVCTNNVFTYPSTGAIIFC